MGGNSLPKYELSKIVCFFDIQYTDALFTYIINPLLEHHVTMSPHGMHQPLPFKKTMLCGAVIFGGRTSLLETWTNFLEVQF